MTDTSINIDEMKADIAAGTDGPWCCHFGNEGMTCNCKYILAEYGGMGSLATIDVARKMDGPWGDDNGPDALTAKANARRIARVPDLEAAYMALSAERDELQTTADRFENEVGAVVSAIRNILNAQDVPAAILIDEHVGNAIVQRDIASAERDALRVKYEAVCAERDAIIADHVAAIAKARDDALVEAANVADYAGAQQVPHDGSYSHHNLVMGPDVANAIQALRTPAAALSTKEGTTDD